jgi:hypothetical protein
MTIPTPSVHVRYAKRKRNQSNIVDDSWDLYWGIERKWVLVQNFAERRKSSARKGRRSTDFKQRVHVFFTASPPSEVIYCNQERHSALLIITFDFTYALKIMEAYKIGMFEHYSGFTGIRKGVSASDGLKVGRTHLRDLSN